MAKDDQFTRKKMAIVAVPAWRASDLVRLAGNVSM
jgi:hypothetical protein